MVLAVEHHEPDGIDADLVHDLSQSDEVAGPLGHFYRFAGPQQLHELNDFHVERRRPAAHCTDRRLHPPDVAAVIPPPDVDHVAETSDNPPLSLRDIRTTI